MKTRWVLACLDRVENGMERKMRNIKEYKISGKIVGIMISCILAISYILYVYIIERRVTEIETIKTFGESAAWKYDVLLEGDQVLFSNGMLYYTNMAKKVTVPLCTTADCEHNTEECTAVYACNNDFMYPYQGKMYLGCTAHKDLEFFRTNLDGSEREKIATYSLGDVISYTEYILVESKLYIAVAVEDTSQMKITDEGSCSDVPIHWELLCFDLELGAYEKIAALGEEYYQHNLYFRNLEGNRLYYEFEGQKIPLEEMYDQKSGELKDPKFRDLEIEGVASIDLDTGKIQIEDQYVTRDYIGSEEGITYFLEYQEDHILSGDIRLERNGTEQKKIHIKDLEQKEGVLCLLQDHFVFNEEGENEGEGRISFFDRSGNLEFKIENVENYVIGEWGPYYVLSSFVIPPGDSHMNSYIKKKDIKQLQTKAVGLIDD